MSQPVTLAIIGCGESGKKCAAYALSHPDKCKIAAIAEPRPKTRRQFADRHNLDQSLVFATWRDLHAASAEKTSVVGKRLADAVFVAVQDHMHAEVTLAFAEQGYHILCETPMATTIEDCLRMERAIKRAGVIFGMNYALRHTHCFQAISQIIRQKTFGDLVNTFHADPVGNHHFAHSYVRGNWSAERKSSSILMTKGCHDIDMLCHWFSPATLSRVSSFGSLTHFRSSNKPQRAGNVKRCIECPLRDEGCSYSATRAYLGSLRSGKKCWPVSVLVDGIPDIENITEALRTGPYGMCVYESPNDVCDQQVVNFEFDNGATASFTVVAYTKMGQRQLRMHFEDGEIVGDLHSSKVTDLRTGKVEDPVQLAGGHAGYRGAMEAFIEAVRTGNQEVLGVTIENVVKSHLAVFAAETSRKEGRVIDCIEFERTARERFERMIREKCERETRRRILKGRIGVKLD